MEGFQIESIDNEINKQETMGDRLDHIHEVDFRDSLLGQQIWDTIFINL
jgi:hypothetical protein